MIRRSNDCWAILVLLVAACGGGDSSGGGGSGGGTAGTMGTAGTSSTAGVMGTAGASSTAGTTAGSGTMVGGTAGDGAAGAGSAMTQCATTETKTGMCKEKAEGVYAMRVDFDVWWHDEVTVPYLLEPGRGTISVYFRGEIKDVCEDGSDGIGVLHPCGSEIPPFFIGANNSAVKIDFQFDWDSPGIPDYHTKGSTTGFNPGDVITIARTAGLLGIRLNEGATFPKVGETLGITCTKDDGTPGMGVDCFPDADGDGKPGVTAKFATTIGGATELSVDSKPYPAPYASNDTFLLMGKWAVTTPPIGVLNVLPTPDQRISEAYVGLMLDAGGSGKVNADCNSGTGASVSGDLIPSRVWDCTKGDGMPCAAADAKFIDDNTPLYHVLEAGTAPPAEWKHPTVPEHDTKLDRSMSKGPRSTVVRMGDLGQKFSCTDIRAAGFPAFD
jgi:hypothetical protein